MVMSRVAALAAAFSLSSMLSSAAFADATSEALVRAFIERIDKDAQWQASAAGVATEGGSTVVTGMKVGREDGSVSVTVPKLALDSLALREGGGIDLAGFMAEKIEMKGASWAFTGEGFAGKGLKTPSFEDWTFDPKTPVTSVARFYTRLAKTEFTEVVLPKGTIEYDVQVPGTPDKTKSKTIYTDMRLDNLSNGILSSQSIARSESVTQSGTLPAMTMVLEGAKANAINLAAIARVLDPDAYANGAGDGQWLTAMENMTYSRMTFKQGDKETGSIGSMTAGRFDVRQPPAPFAQAIDELIAKGDKPSDQDVLAFFDKHFSSLAGWFRIESMEMKDLAISPEEGGAIKLASLGLKDLSSDGLKSFAINSFTVDSPQFTAKLGLFEVADVTWPSFQTFMTFGMLEETKKKGGTPDPVLLDKVASNFLDIFPRIGRMEIRDVSGGMPNSEPLTLKSYLATNTGGSSLLPEDASAKIDTLVIPRGILRATPESTEIFDQLGYNELIVNIEGKAKHDNQGGSYASDASFSVNDAGTLLLAYGFGGITTDNIRAIIKPLIQSQDGNPDPAAFMMAVSPLSIDNFKIRYEDASLIKRVLPLAAKMQGTDEATLIGNVTAMLQLGLSQLKNPAFTQQVVDSVGSFLKAPRSLTLSLKPAKPVQFMELMQIDPNNPGAAIDLLGVSMKAND